MLKRKNLIILASILSVSTLCGYFTIKSFNKTPVQNTFALYTDINGELNSNSEIEIKVTFENKTKSSYVVTSGFNLVNIILQEKIDDKYQDYGVVLIAKSHFIYSREKIVITNNYFLEEDKDYRFIAWTSISTRDDNNDRLSLKYTNAYEFSQGKKSQIEI